MRRRSLVAGAAALAGLLASGSKVVAAARRRTRPGDAGWPMAAAWDRLKDAVGGRLAPVVAPDLGSPEARRLIGNPIYLGDQPAFTQMSGWVDAWSSSPSAYVVTAETAADVAAAIRFGRAHDLRLVVKGGGHSYLGGSSAPDSLLIWTRRMDAIVLHDAFVPTGSRAAPVPAVSVGAGCVWGRVYDAVTTMGGRYVQGGGCTTVGVAGLVQGGGFGSFSKQYGLAAASLLEAEVVTADGRVRVVNASREPDLFWALKGGGGGSFGVVTRMTLRTHDLPETFGVIRLTVKAASDDAFRRLIARFLDLYAAGLCNPHWGEQVRVTGDNRLIAEMSFAGLDEATARAAWRDLEAFALASPADYRVIQPLLVLVFPARRFWDRDFLAQTIPSAIATDPRPGARVRDFWWAGDGEQAGRQWHAVASAWLPARLLEPPGRATLTEAWFAASRHWPVGFHFNKGLAGGDAAVRAAARETAMNPQAADAFALAISASLGPSTFPGMPPSDPAAGRIAASRVRAAMAALREAAPEAGNYLSECDYLNADWRTASWGPHWDRLSRIKRRYDPDGLFTVHHGVGSEDWSPDGFTRRAPG